MDNTGKKGSFKIFFVIMIISLVIAFYWQNSPWLRQPIHNALDPSLGALLQWNLTIGMLVIVFFITLITTLFQKYTTDQKTIRELKERQKEINKEMKELQHEPEKMMEIQKEMMPLSMELMKMSTRPIMFTGVPFILFFRWFMDFFTAMGEPKFFGTLSWFWFYLIFAMIFGSILRKILKVA